MANNVDNAFSSSGTFTFGGPALPYASGVDGPVNSVVHSFDNFSLGEPAIAHTPAVATGVENLVSGFSNFNLREISSDVKQSEVLSNVKAAKQNRRDRIQESRKEERSLRTQESRQEQYLASRERRAKEAAEREQIREQVMKISGAWELVQGFLG